MNKHVEHGKLSTRLIVLLAGLVLAVGGGTALVFRARSIRAANSQVSIVLGHDLPDEVSVAALEKELREYSSLFPTVTVSLRRGLQNDADVAVLPSYPARITDWAQPPVPWSGLLWVLAAHGDRLEELSAVMPDAVASLRAGTLDPAGFEALLAAARDKDLSPITLGNSHGWPFVMWLQFWTAATAGTDAALALPGRSGTEYPAVEAAIADLRRWRAQAWFDAGSWPLGWAQGLAPLNDGSAVFAILSAPQLTALSQATRSRLEYLPFPRSAGATPWAVGSATYLATSSKSEKKAAAGSLVRYLSSPGVTSRLAKATGRPFFAWDAESGQPPVVIGAWYDEANTPDFQTLARYLQGE